MLHLRDPVRALEAIRSVCSEWFMSVEEVSLGLSVVCRRRPVAEMRFSPDACQWWVPNAAGHQRMLEASGFEVTRTVGPFAEPFGPAHRSRNLWKRLRYKPWLPPVRHALLGNDGVPHHAVLARSVLDAPPIRL
jgi:hypothetical protein